ncbi:MAG: nucleoside hydrolase [Armatimonadota bacterium]
MQRRVIIDTDPGVDDSMAVQFGLRSPEVRIEALTSVFGNNPVEITTRNALKNLEVAGRPDIPVAPGAGKPLLRPYSGRGSIVHGDDGLGNSNLTPPRLQPSHRRAAEMIVERVMAEPGEITILALGPLTNVALAVSLEPRIAQHVREVVFMGGAATVRGNAAPAAEANIHNDPEAAKIVFHAGWPLTMIGLDVTTQVQMNLSHLQRLRSAGTAVGDFLAAIMPHYLNQYRERYGLDGQMFVHDPSAMIYLIDPTLFRARNLYVDVETRGEATAGETVPDLRNRWDKAPNVTVCLEVDGERLVALYFERILG